jgi:hypothetical protein
MPKTSNSHNHIINSRGKAKKKENLSENKK